MNSTLKSSISNTYAGSGYSIIGGASGGTATITADGIIVTDFVVGSVAQSKIDLYINGLLRKSLYASTNTTLIEQQDSCPVFKGDVVKVETTSSALPYRATVNFIPKSST